MRTRLMFLVIIAVFGHVTAQWPGGYGFNNKDPRYYIKIKRMLCEVNPNLVNLTHCIMKLERNTNGKYTVGLKFAASEPKMTLKLAAWSRLSANIYRPTPFQQTLDLCDFIANKNRPSLVTLFMPTFFDIVQIPGCPFKGHNIFNVTVPLLNVDPILGVTGDHKMVCNISRTNSVFLFSLTFEVYVKSIKTY